MTYVDTLHTHTNLTTPASPWAEQPPVVCDFGWYGTLTGAIFGLLAYSVAGNLYPPAETHFQDYVVALNQEVTFDVNDSNQLGLPTTVAAPGITVLSYSWDLGNGVTGQGPVITTTYTYTVIPPDLAATLTVVDSLGRKYSTTHRLNLTGLTPTGGVEAHVSTGTGRSS